MVGLRGEGVEGEEAVVVEEGEVEGFGGEVEGFGGEVINNSSCFLCLLQCSPYNERIS